MSIYLMDVRICCYIIVAFHGLQLAHSTCTWPSGFQNTEWWDSTRGSLSFTSSDMSGFNVGIKDFQLSEWECYDESHYASQRILVLKCKQSFNYIAEWRPYLCLELNPVTENSFRYYQLSDQEINAGKERVYVASDDDTPSTDRICGGDMRARGREFSVLVRKGSETSVNTTCPQPLQGRFDFTYTSPDGSLLCDNSADLLDVCSDVSTLNFSPACPDQSIVYADAEVFCVASVMDGDNAVVQLFNPQQVTDGVNTHRFSCMVVSSDSMSASVVYNNCTEHQTPTYAARRHDGVIIGSLISLEPIEFCKLPTTTTQSTTTPVRTTTPTPVTTTTPTPAPTTSAPSVIAEAAADTDNGISVVVAVLVSIVAAVVVAAVVTVVVWKQRRKKFGTEVAKLEQRPDNNDQKFSSKPVSASVASMNVASCDASSNNKCSKHVGSYIGQNKTDDQGFEEIKLQQTSATSTSA